LITADYLRIVPADGDEVRIDVATRAILALHSGHRWVGELRWLNAREVYFKPRGWSHPLTWDAIYVRAVQTADGIFVYDRERCAFRSVLYHYLYARESSSFRAMTNRDATMNTFLAQNATVKLTNGFQFPALLRLTNSYEFSLSIVGRGPEEVPASCIHSIDIAAGSYVYNPKSGNFEFTHFRQAHLVGAFLEHLSAEAVKHIEATLGKYVATLVAGDDK
jgi:hypothetical protein